jgi:hypothetical protein
MRMAGAVLASPAAVYRFPRRALSFGDIGELVLELPRHSSTRYITRRSLPAGWFGRASAALDDPHIYIVLSDTASPAGRFIRFFTSALYTHVSLSFDRNLETLVSYNGGNGVSSPGLNAERLEFFSRRAGASLALYRLRLERGQKAALIERIRAIDREGSSYNLLGLLTGKSRLPNIMFCSQFVYSLLDGAGLAYFKKEGGTVRPEDFIREEGPEFVGRMAFDAPAAWGSPARRGRVPRKLGILPRGLQFVPNS